MPKRKKPTAAERILHEERYIAFLEKQLASARWGESATAEKIAATKEKLKKARFVLRTLRQNGSR